MGHMLDFRADGTAAMFSVRETPWHGLGLVLDEYPGSWDEARKLAGLDWEPVVHSMYDANPVIGPDGPTMEYNAVEGFNLIKRSDTGLILAAAKESYEVYPNKELGPLVEALLDQSGGKYEYETAGALDEGRKVWVLIRAAEPFKIPGDPRGDVLPYMALQNSHDGSGALRAQRLRMRIVCRNTSHGADLEAQGHGLEYSFKHTKSIHDRVEQAKQVLAGMSKDQVLAQEWAAELISMPVSLSGRRAFIESFIPMPVGEVITERVKNNIDGARKQVEGYLTSVTCEGIENTAYGLVQAAIEFLDHGRKSRNAETKFRRTVLSAEPMKRQAEKLAREASLV